MSKPVNRHIMALVNFIALVPLVYFIPPWVAQFFPGNKLLQVITAVGIIVPIISYLVVPNAVRLINRL